MIFAGLCNAVGIVLYGKILETKDSTKYIILLMVLIPIVTYAGSICVFKEKFEPEKLISLGVIIIGLYFFLR
jgi:multidrug transporter EmrE-like cation transporter